jgi:hypothetical protein
MAVSCSFHGGSPLPSLGRTHILDGSVFGGWVTSLRVEVAAVIEHVLSQKSGEWRVVILGSQANDQWEMKITGPNAFERSYTLEGTAGQHEPQVT